MRDSLFVIFNEKGIVRTMKSARFELETAQERIEELEARADERLAMFKAAGEAWLATQKRKSKPKPARPAPTEEPPA